LIEWEVANTDDLDHFILEKSMDSRRFFELNTFEKQEGSHFSYSDELSGGKSYYRLKSVEIDGTLSYSEIHSIINEESEWKIFPNPIKETLHIQSVDVFADSEKTEIKIYDAFGHLLFLENRMIGRSISINTNGWNSGVYILEIKNGNNMLTRKLVK